MSRERFEELLKSKLDRTEVRPPADMWARLEGQLPEIRRNLAFGGEEAPGQGGSLPAPRIRRPLRHKMRWAYVAASVGIVFTMVFALRNLDDQSRVQVADTATDPPAVVEEKKQEPAGGPEISGEGRVITVPTVASSPARTAVVAAATPSGAASGTFSPATIVEDTRSAVTGSDAGTGEDTVQAAGEVTSPGTVPPDGNAPSAGGTPEKEDTRPYMNDLPDPRTWQPQKRSSNVSTSVFAMNAAGTNTISGNVYGRTKLMKSTLVVTEVDGVPDEDETASSFTRASTREYKLKHDLPLSFGASVNFGIWNRVSIETGLTYTYMRSKGETTFGSSATSTLTQKLHYLGIPVKIRYDFFQTRIADLYVSGGGSVEKLLTGKQVLRNRDSSGNVSATDKTTSFTVGSLQGSVGANVGVQFNIDKTFGFYLEPGVGYFFENGNQPESYRTENPFNFTLKAGFRVNL